jgi:hypothetical protein
VDAILRFVVDHPQVHDALFWIHVISGLVVFLVAVAALTPLLWFLVDSWLRENIKYTYSRKSNEYIG